MQMLTVAEVSRDVLLRVALELVYLERLKVAVWMSRGHSHGLILWWRGSRSIRCSSWARVVLGSSP